MASSSGAGRPSMDNSTALELVRQGSSLFFLDVPQFTLIGIDTQVVSVGPKFKGIKMIPPGTHFVYYCNASKERNEFAPTIGFFVTTHPSEVIVRRWDCHEERLIKVSEEEEYRYSEAVKRMEFDDQLGPYDLRNFGKWVQLSDYISQSILKRVEPIGGEFSIVYETNLSPDASKTAIEECLQGQLTESKFVDVQSHESQMRHCYFTTIPTSIKDKHVTSEKLTALNLDKTNLLEVIIANEYGGEEDQLLGELQITFIAFMMGQSLEAFMQWKALVCLLMSCTEAPLQTRTKLFCKFIKVIYYQLKYGFQNDRQNKGCEVVENSLFLDEAWFTRDIFLYRMCKDFFPLVLEASIVDGNLLGWTRKLKTLLETTLGWELDNTVDDIFQEDEFAPVIVNL